MTTFFAICGCVSIFCILVCLACAMVDSLIDRFDARSRKRADDTREDERRRIGQQLKDSLSWFDGDPTSQYLVEEIADRIVGRQSIETVGILERLKRIRSEQK